MRWTPFSSCPLPLAGHDPPSTNVAPTHTRSGPYPKPPAPKHASGMESPTTSTRTSYSGLRHVVGPGYPARLSDASDAAHVHASDTSDAATDASAHVGVAEVDAGSSARTAWMSSASAAVEIGSTRSRSRRRRGASDALGGGVGAFSAASASSAPSAPTDDRGSAMVTGDAGDGTPLTTWRY